MKSWDDFCNPQRRNSTWWTIFGDQRGETGWENIVMRHRFLIRTTERGVLKSWDMAEGDWWDQNPFQRNSIKRKICILSVPKFFFVRPHFLQKKRKKKEKKL